MDLHTFGLILRHSLCGYVEIKIAERKLPHLTRLPENMQMWCQVKLGMSEKQVGNLLGLPTFIYEPTEREPSWDVRWMYNWDRRSRQVFFKGKEVVGLEYIGEEDFVYKGICAEWRK